MRHHRVPCVVAALLLLGCLGHWPYAYYQFLRLTVTTAAAYVARTAWSFERYRTAWLFVAICLLFNPIAPVFLRRGVWIPIDIATAVAFVVAAATDFSPRERVGEPSERQPDERSGGTQERITSKPKPVARHYVSW